jgi:GAF domain-containing protein
MAGLTDAQPYAGGLAAVDRILNREADADEALRQVVAVVHEHVPHYSWIGLYFVEDGELALGPWQGEEPPARSRLPLGYGLIGAAIADRRTQVANDVGRIAGYEACFPWTKAEIDVPIVYQGQAIAVLGVDSDTAEGFGDADREFLERVALLISAHCLVGWDTGGVPWRDVV